ncbi:hypothetical protein N0V90_004571 [Kalmusia sp. IMI 367209]|nr:hypothetical protein N0V90_004571 [Kalmusia sp. IMI 367209]
MPAYFVSFFRNLNGLRNRSNTKTTQPLITIRIDDNCCNGDDDTSYSTADIIKGTVLVTAKQDTPIEEIDLAFADMNLVTSLGEQ